MLLSSLMQADVLLSVFSLLEGLLSLRFTQSQKCVNPRRSDAVKHLNSVELVVRFLQWGNAWRNGPNGNRNRLYLLCLLLALDWVSFNTLKAQYVTFKGNEGHKIFSQIKSLIIVLTWAIVGPHVSCGGPHVSSGGPEHWRLFF